MNEPTQAIKHPSRRLIIDLPQPYDAARTLYETLVPEVDYGRFSQPASWQAHLDLADTNAPHGFMYYYRADVTAIMATSTAGWKATQ